MTNWLLPAFVITLREVLGDEVVPSIDIAKNQSAWVAVPVFGLASTTGQPVPEVAQSIAEQVRRALPEANVEVAGGYVNVTPSSESVEVALRQAAQPDYGAGTAGSGQTIVIDFSSPNIAKPMSIGHLRSTILGDALRRLLESQSYNVVSINYLGDWGTQYGKLVVAYADTYGDLEPRSEIGIRELFDLYVRYHADSEEQTALDERARAMFKRLEDGDPAVRQLWQFFVERSVEEFQAMYDRLNVQFSEPRMGESAHRDRFAAVTELVKRHGHAESSEGAIVVRLDEEQAPLILQKSDGATTYAARDLAALQDRVERYQPASVLYVVSNEQTLHFEQVFAVARLVGIAPDSVSLEHVKFGFVRLPEGKMSTRHGRIILLQDVLDEAVRRARTVVDEKNPTLDQEERSRIAESVGVGAVKYFDLAHDRHHDILFDWDRILSLKGDSAPYLQYTLARAQGVLRKLSASPTQGREESHVSLEASLWPMARLIAKFPVIVTQAGAERAPHRLCQYLNELAASFHRFYEEYPVLSAPVEVQPGRVSIVTAVANVMERGLELLGIDPVSQM